VPSSPRKGGHHEEDPGSQVRAGPPDQRLHAGVRRRSLLPALGPAPCPVPSRPWKGGHHEEDPGSQDRAGPPDQRLHAGIRRRSLLRIAGAAGAGAGAVRLARTAPADGPRIAVPCPQATCVHAPRLQTRLQTPLANALASGACERRACSTRAWNTALATPRLQHRALPLRGGRVITRAPGAIRNAGLVRLADSRHGRKQTPICHMPSHGKAGLIMRRRRNSGSPVGNIR
jgi:hypothetical protein